MKSPTPRVARTVRFTALSLLLIAAGIVGQPALAGGNAAGAPSGVTLAGTSSAPPASVAAMIATLGGPQVTITQGTNAAGVPTTTRSVVISTNLIANAFSVLGLPLPVPGTSRIYASLNPAVTFTISNNNGVMTLSRTTPTSSVN
ncbi:MAG: hypothetical protein IT507_12225 [Burkholderiaceae bacterium]|nr:hypothetical protein [Burkholderiaceae bacterium]